MLIYKNILANYPFNKGTLSSTDGFTMPCSQHTHFNTGLQKDIFTPSNNIHFTAIRHDDTKNGKFLKNLEDITDPYSGAKILKREKYEEFADTVPYIENIEERMQNIMHYEKYMRPVEKEVYKTFWNEITKAKRQAEETDNTAKIPTFSQILRRKLPEAKSRLKEKELNTLRLAKEECQSMKPNDAKKVQTEIQKLWKSIESDNHKFKRKYFIERMEELRAENNNQHFRKLVEIAHKLPSSYVDKDAFIVKYAECTDEEITQRLLSSSVGTIEHIIAASDGGSDEASNFLLTTAGSNIERDSIPIEDYMKIHKNIPQYVQSYMNDIIKAGNKGQLDGYEWYPYVVVPTIEKEMGIVVDLSDYKISEKDAFQNFPERLWNNYPQYKKYFNRSANQ